MSGGPGHAHGYLDAALLDSGRAFAHYQAINTNVGTMYAAFRPAGDDVYYRIAQFLFPFYTMIPTGVLGLEVRVRAWVPIDDGHTFGLGMHKVASVDTPGEARPLRDPTRLLPNTTHWLGRFRTEANARNDFQIDREKQRRLESYTGLPSITIEDQAVTETMGEIYDRTQEHLGTSDTMIIRTRRRMIDAAKALRDTGVSPPACNDPKAYAVRTGGIMLPKGVDWVEGSAELRRGFVDHPELSRQVLGGIPAV